MTKFPHHFPLIVRYRLDRNDPNRGVCSAGQHYECALEYVCEFETINLIIDCFSLFVFVCLFPAIFTLALLAQSVGEKQVQNENRQTHFLWSTHSVTDSGGFC